MYNTKIMVSITQMKENVKRISDGMTAIVDGYVNQMVTTLDDITDLDPQVVSMLKTSQDLMELSMDMLADTISVYEEVLKNQEDIKKSLARIEAKMA